MIAISVVEVEPTGTRVEGYGLVRAQLEFVFHAQSMLRDISHVEILQLTI